MEASDSAPVEEQASPEDNTERKLAEFFATYRAEWLGERLFELFAAPEYLPDLTTTSPCVLRGGRGTGKTTVLRGLSYEGRLALSPQTIDVSSWDYYGMYYRIDTNRVTAFGGTDASPDEWRKLFAHYFNLQLSVLVMRFLQWYELRSGEPVQLPPTALRAVALSLHLPVGITTNNDLLVSLRESLLILESYINNVAEADRPALSLQKVPVDTLLEAIHELPQFAGKSFFFLLDEFETLNEDQQRVVNTYIKHCGVLYTFKVGLRELGWHVRTTLNLNEELSHPADYVLIDIGDRLRGPKFTKFATDVCNERYGKLLEQLGYTETNIRKVFPGLTQDREAELLGVGELAEAVRSKLLSEGIAESNLKDTSDLELYFVDYWSRSTGSTAAAEFRDFQKNVAKWHERFGNYKYALLYTLRRGRGNRGIQKYYTGWSTFTQICDANIRYMLELVYESLSLHLQEDHTLVEPVTAKTQTTAAQRVGEQILVELEGLSAQGGRLKRLVLSLGRLLGLMAAQPEGSTPEVNQFRVDWNVSPEANDATKDLLDAGVMHLALRRSSGTKLGSQGDTKDYDYFVHPIFAPFFVFSHRRKRKMVLSSSDVLGLIDSPSKTIRAILERSDRHSEEDFPEQLKLFESYFERAGT